MTHDPLCEQCWVSIAETIKEFGSTHPTDDLEEGAVASLAGLLEALETEGTTPQEVSIEQKDITDTPTLP